MYFDYPFPSISYTKCLSVSFSPSPSLSISIPSSILSFSLTFHCLSFLSLSLSRPAHIRLFASFQFPFNFFTQFLLLFLLLFSLPPVTPLPILCISLFLFLSYSRFPFLSFSRFIYIFMYFLFHIW